MPEIKLQIKGVNYTGWESVQISRSIEALSAGFRLEISDYTPLTIRPADECKVYADNDLILDGYIDTVDISTNSIQNIINISGRDKTGDLIDASAVNDSQEFIDIDFKTLLETIAKPFGINVTLDIAIEKFKKFSLQQESAYEAIERAARLRGVFANSTPDGNLAIYAYGKTRANTKLEAGVNILSYSVNYNFIDRFNKYIVRGQNSGTDTYFGEDAAAPEGIALDKNIKRYRPLIVLAESNIDSAKATERAQWEATVRAARSTEINCTVQGWRQSENGSLWQVNQLINVKIPQHGIDTDLLIKSVEFTKDNNSGTLTQLTLVNKNSYIKQPEVPVEDDLFGVE